MDGVPVAWLSAETTVAAVDASGLVTAVGGGAVTVTARAGEASGDALVTVAIDLDGWRWWRSTTRPTVRTGSTTPTG